MFNRYDSHDTNQTWNITQGLGGPIILIGGLGVAAFIGIGMVMAAIAAMIWAIVTGLLGVTLVAGVVVVLLAKEKTKQSNNIRAVETLAQLLKGMQASGQAPDISTLAPVIDAVAAPLALPASQPIMVNGQPYRQADAARRARSR